MATQAEVDRLRSLAARGVLEVRNADGSAVKYASASEMLRVAQELENRMGTAEFQRSTFASFARD